MNALDFLRRQHEDVERALLDYVGLDGSDEDREKLARAVVTKLSVHLGVEEVVFYPRVRDALPGLADVIDRDVGHHHRVKDLLAAAQRSGDVAGGLDAAADRVLAAVRDHVVEQEKRVFPEVAAVLGDGELDELGEALRAGARAV